MHNEKETQVMEPLDICINLFQKQVVLLHTKALTIISCLDNHHHIHNSPTYIYLLHIVIQVDDYITNGNYPNGHPN